MARSTSTGDAMSRVNNPFLGKSLASMKKQWSSMTPAQRKVNVENFRKAAKVAPKPTKAVRSASTSTNSAKTKGDGSVKPIPVKRSRSTEVKNNKPVQAKSKPIQSDPALKTQPRKASTHGGNRRKEDPRARGLRNNVRDMEAATRKRNADTRRQNQKKAFSNTGIPASPSKNPKKNDLYKKPFGNVMIYNGTKWVRK